MITIDPLDDEVVQKAKSDHSRSKNAQRSPRQQGRADARNEKRAHSRLVALALRLLHGRVEEEDNG